VSIYSSHFRPCMKFSCHRYMRKSAGTMSPQRSTAAPYATDRKDEKNVPLSVSSHLDQLSRRRPVSAPRMAHTASQPGSPYGTDKNAITPPPPRTNSPRRAGVDSVVAPWSNPANMYDQARNGKRTATETSNRPETARERRRQYGQDLLSQIKERESLKAKNMLNEQIADRRNITSKSMAALTRGLGERKPWM